MTEQDLRNNRILDDLVKSFQDARCYISTSYLKAALMPAVRIVKINKNTRELIPVKLLVTVDLIIFPPVQHQT